MAPSNASKQDATSFNLGTLPQSLAEILDQVQVSVANHRKNCVNLHKYHARASSVVEATANGAHRLTGEHSFTTIFITLLSRILCVKRGIQPADRVVKFVGMYMKFMVEKGAFSCHHSTSAKSICLPRAPRLRRSRRRRRHRRHRDALYALCGALAQLSIEGVRSKRQERAI